MAEEKKKRKPAVKSNAAAKWTKTSVKDGPAREEKPGVQDKRAGKGKGRPGSSEDGCKHKKACGGCRYQGIPYEKQCRIKQKEAEKFLEGFCRVMPIISMENPYHYRNKVHAAFDHDRKGNPISGIYKAGTHTVVPVDSCLIEDKKSDEIIVSIRKMLRSFKIRTYDEDTGYGLLRHVLVRRGFQSGQIMVVLVTASPVFPSKNNFVKALLKEHPQITTIVQNVNNRGTSMVLGDKEQVLYGKGYIEDTLCSCVFRISSKSFYQVNPVQTEKLYGKAMELAGLTGEETVIDAYCGIGTIGIVASSQAKHVIGIELNRDAVRDAVFNAKRNQRENIVFYQKDASRFMQEMAASGQKADVVFLDPPRSGSTEEFVNAAVSMEPERIVYVSCNLETLARDLGWFEKKGYQAREAWPVDMFAWADHTESIVLLQKSVK